MNIPNTRVCFSFLMMLILAACSIIARSEEMIASDTLTKLAESQVIEMYDEAVRSGMKPSKGMTKADLIARGMEMYKPILMVTPEQEEKYKKGEFNNESNQKTMKDMIRLFEKLEVSLPQLTADSIKKFQAGTLTDGALELAVRLNQVLLNQAKAVLEKK